MKIFERKIDIKVDLGNKTMIEVMNLPEKSEAGTQEFYVAETYNTNHIQIRVKDSEGYKGGMHDFRYEESKKTITVWSRFDKGDLYKPLN